jgi:O-antigen ligase
MMPPTISDSSDSFTSAAVDGHSGKVFAGILLLVLLAVTFPEMPPQGLMGILWAGAGLLMILWPPVLRLPRWWTALAAGFILFALAGFLPREWFQIPSWRRELEAGGGWTGRHGFLQPLLTAEVMSGFAATAIVVLFLLGHRTNSAGHQRIALSFVLGVGAWTSAALLTHERGGLFGFFPNRNHTATLLAMGAITGLGCLAHAIRRKDPWKIPLSAIPLILCLYTLLVVSESRAGVVLTLAGLSLWVILTGFRHLQGNAGKALILLLIAAAGIFSIVDSTARKRLTTTMEQLSTPEPDVRNAPPSPFSDGTTSPQEVPADGRVSIFQDTLRMIHHEPWTGVGPGQFAQVFPQYREKISASNDSKCLHPESDWLMMLAETGWPATLCLAGGVVWVFIVAVKQARMGRARFLRTGSIAGASLLCIHGIFDVPGHRVGLAWAAALLLALSLRAQPGSGSLPNRFSGHSWRGIGLILAAGGLFLINAQWSGRYVLPSVQVRQSMRQAENFYDQDQAAYDRAKSEGSDYDPPPAEDPLMAALAKVGQAVDIAPLDPYLHYVRGSLALHYDDQRELAVRSFGVQRRLEPTRVNVPLHQALAWNVQDSHQVSSLWKEALNRAATEDARQPNSPFGVKGTYQRLVQASGKEASLISAALDVAGKDPALMAIWARSVPANSLDVEMPRLLSESVEAREILFKIWLHRGSKGVAADFARRFPELGLPQP